MSSESKKITERCTSYVTAKKDLAEMIYDPVEKKTAFLVHKDGIIKKVEKIEIDEMHTILPISPMDDRIKLKVVKCPSEAAEYESDKALFDEVELFIQQYVSLTDSFRAVATTYIFMSWLYDQFHVLPYLRVIGDYGTGKSRFLDVVGGLCYKPISFTGSASTSSIFRTIHDIRGTLILDEGDFAETGSASDIAKLLNSGHKQGGAVQRTQMMSKNDTYRLDTFEVFGPKVVASRERWSDEALESRSLSQLLFSNTDSTKPLHLPKEFESEALKLRNKLLMFRFRNVGAVDIDESSVSEIKSLRVRQTALALVATAGLFEDDLLIQRITKFLKGYERDLKRTQTVSNEADVLVCIGRLYGDKNKIYMKAIAGQYSKYFGDGTPNFEDSPNRMSLSPRKIGHIVNRKLHLRTNRDGDGVYIPVSLEKQQLDLLLERFGITPDIIGIDK